jgi:hypothetical protein
MPFHQQHCVKYAIALHIVNNAMALAVDSLTPVSLK